MEQIILRIKKIFFQILLAGLIAQLSGIGGLGKIELAQAAPLDRIVVNEFMSNPSSGNEWVEIYNPTAISVNVTGYKVTSNDGSQELGILSGSLAARGFMTVEKAGTNLANAGDDVELRDDVGNLINEIVYGSGQMVAAPSQGQTAGRTPDGDDTLASNLNFTKAFSNTTPTAVQLDQNYVNYGNQRALTGQVTAPNAGGAADKIDLILTDGLNQQKVIPLSSFSAGANVISGIDASGLADGLIQVQARTDYGGDKSSVLSGAGVTKDTVSPTSSIITTGYWGPDTWSGQIEGTAQDALSGIDKNYLTLQRLSDNYYWNGSAWQAGPIQLAALGAASWSYAFDKVNLTHGVSYEVGAQAQDKAGNLRGVETRSQFSYDNIPPVGIFQINSGKEYTNTRNVILTSQVTEATSGVTQMMASQDPGFSGASWIGYSQEVNFSLTDSYGPQTIYMKYRDGAGNVSSVVVDSIIYIGSLASTEINPPATGTLSALNPILNAESQYQAWLEISGATQGTTFASIASYKGDPSTGFPAGLAVVGSFLDFSAANQTAFPVLIRVYYTAEDLAQAQVTESQLMGLYFWDSGSQTWKKFEHTGVNTTNFNGFEGFVWAEADHLTPVAIGADNLAPEKPAGLLAQPQTNKIKLTWEKVSDSVGYVVRYRQKTADDRARAYTQVYLPGADTLSTTIDLTAGQEYEFGVAAKDNAGNFSQFAVVVAAPAAEVIVSQPKTQESVVTPAAEEVVPIGGVFVPETVKAEEETPPQVSEIPTQEPEDQALEEGKEIKGEEKTTEVSSDDRRRLIVALVILALAIAAGIGGYYAYEWWLSQPEREPGKRGTKKGKGNGRW